MAPDPTQEGRRSAALVVELPGIEPAAIGPMTCGNAGIDNARRRETTSSDLRIHREVLTASTRMVAGDLAVCDSHVAIVLRNGWRSSGSIGAQVRRHHGIASAHFILPSKPNDVAMAR
jgi:hypothetical protein